MLLILKSTRGQNATIEKTVNKITILQNHVNDTGFFPDVQAALYFISALREKSLQQRKVSGNITGNGNDYEINI